VNSGFTVWWDQKTGSIGYIDQTLLPNEERIVECRSIRRLAKAIQRLEIRGAPALGVAGAFGILLAASRCRKKTLEPFLAAVARDAAMLRSTRPTAVNLGWGIDRVLDAMMDAPDVPGAQAAALTEAEKIFSEDTACCHAIGEHGAPLLPDTCTILTHCNAGALACSSWGTALGVIRSAVKIGKTVSVIACETRPLLQGSRLTAWELARDGIPITVITDSMTAHVMRSGTIDAVIVGADRICGDAVFNKIGTYMHAVLARHHKIPFYVAAPLSTFDLTRKAREVVIEERGRAEIATIGNRTFLPPGVPVQNPAFDATPVNLVSAIITEKGIIRPPFTMNDMKQGRTK
jgi:methylthioribose-1-phosphate isomerase